MNPADVHFIYSMYRALYDESATIEGLLVAILCALIITACLVLAHVARHWDD